MTRLYVYSPASATIWAQDYYCSLFNLDGSRKLHFISFVNEGWTNPFDVGGGGLVAGDYVWFAAGGVPNCAGSSVPIASAGTKQRNGICQGTGPPPWDNGVQVDMYTQSDGRGYIGSVMYCHLYNRIADGIYNVDSGSGCITLPVGNAPADNCGCQCHHGVHIHMQKLGGVARPESQVPCGANVTLNASWLYYFDF